MGYNNEYELYKSMMPVFEVKRRLTSITKYNFDEKEIWLYLKENKWSKSINLQLYEIVNDIITFELNKLKY